MTPKRRRIERVLGIDPTSRGFGFVVLEGSNRLVDWGLKEVRSNKEDGVLHAVTDLLELYGPTVVIVEDTRDRSSRRGPRVSILLNKVIAMVEERRVRTARVSPWVMHVTMAREGALTKYSIAEAIVRRFPELATRRPPLRKPWMSEDERQAIFDAAAFALAFLERRRARS